MPALKLLIPAFIKKKPVHSSKNHPVYFSGLIKMMAVAGFLMLMLQVGAQDTLINVLYDFNNNKEKFEPYKKSKYKLDVKNGKLYIRQKSDGLQAYGLNLFALSDSRDLFNVHSTYEFKFMEGKEDAAFGLSFITYDKRGSSNYYRNIWFMIKPDGRLQYYNGPDIDEKTIISRPSEPCASFKPGMVNKIEFLRNKKDWCLVINGDTAKRSSETDLYPIINLYSGRFTMYGNYEVEIDNFNFIVQSDKEERDKKIKNLSALAGTYLTYSGCLKTETKRLSLVLKHESNSKFTLTGLGADPVTLYLEQKKDNVFVQDNELSVRLGGVLYMLRRLKITVKESGRANLTFNMMAQDAKTFTDCDFDGDR